ncbi:NAD(P)H pyrophosphatase NUDT13, mitochondrial-like [Diadema antillarum]|uniref:NAD(P)H pyrophosphatase NUDT13, mitochondrial-like n=1 Tax=Diadema antillarum TaxID=105358 RepID=UPI003A83C723
MAATLLRPQQLLPMTMCASCYHFCWTTARQLNGGPQSRCTLGTWPRGVSHFEKQSRGIKHLCPFFSLQKCPVIRWERTNTVRAVVTEACRSRVAFLSSKSCVTAKQQQSGISQYVAGMRHLEKLRENDKLCEDAMKTGEYAVFYDLKALVRMDEESSRMSLAWRDASEMDEILALSGGLKLSHAVLLNSTSRGFPDRPAKFALNVAKGDETSQQSLESAMGAQVLGIRRALFGVRRKDIEDLLQAYAILQWHSLQGFCSKCGGVNEKNMAGNRRICSKCSEVHYPTMKPIVITLVVDKDRCLVARQPQFPEGMYSALAGFCDMGETLEAAVKREVAEEVGLEIDNITYSSSQHWPFPSSGLMLGCYGNLKGDSELSVDKNELEDARWISRDEVQSILESRGQGSIWLPPKQAIAHHLLRDWAFAN